MPELQKASDRFRLLKGVSIVVCLSMALAGFCYHSVHSFLFPESPFSFSDKSTKVFSKINNEVLEPAFNQLVQEGLQLNHQQIHQQILAELAGLSVPDLKGRAHGALE